MKIQFSHLGYIRITSFPGGEQWAADLRSVKVKFLEGGMEIVFVGGDGLFHFLYSRLYFK